MLIPLWPELGVRQMWNTAMAIPGFSQCMPHNWDRESKNCERAFFWGIICTINYPYAEALVESCRTQRILRHQASVPRPVFNINVSEDWAQLLMQHPWIPNGKCPPC